MQEEPQWEKYVDQIDVLPMKNTPGIAPFGRKRSAFKRIAMHNDVIARREEMIRRVEGKREKEEFERIRRKGVKQKYRLDREEERRRSEQFQLSMLMALCPNCRGLAGTDNNRSSPIASNPTDSSLLSAGSSILEQTATHVSTNTVINLSYGDAIKLLEENGLDKYSELFQLYGIDGVTSEGCDQKTLPETGVKSAFDCAKILSMSKRMKAIVNGQANSASGIDFVIEALHEINLGKYSDLFSLNGSDEYVLEQANHDMLKEIGITSSIDRAKIIGLSRKLSFRTVR